MLGRRSGRAVVGLGNRRLGDPVAFDLIDHHAAPKHQDTIADCSELFIVRAGAEHSCPLFRRLGDCGENLGAGADINPLRRFIEQHETRGFLQPFGQQRLLLVAAGERAEQQRRVARPDVKTLGKERGILRELRIR